MSPNNKFTLSMTAIIVAGICTLSLGGCAIQRHHERALYAAGYQETAVQGVVGMAYQKAK